MLMAHAYSDVQFPTHRAAGEGSVPQPYWNPYLVGVLLGLVLLATYVITGRGLGATGAFGSLAAWIAGVFSPEHAASNPVHAKYYNEGAQLESWTLFLLIGAFVGALVSGMLGRRIRFMVERGPRVSDGQRLALAFAGGFIAAYGAKLAKGCTSGQALTGGAILNVGSLVFMVGSLPRICLHGSCKVAVMPLSSSMEFTLGVELAIAFALGIGFGFSLERAGFGSARKLTAVFYLHDMAVVKVMFTAIVTAMVGLTVLAAAGVLDLKELYLEPTNFAAQGLGGLIFGAGFIIGGYCPGTAIVAIATARKDGMAFALGMLAGVLAYAELTPGIDAWIKATAQGEMTLPTATGLAMGWYALAFLAFLLLAARGMAALERRFRHLRPQG
jgi:hypothetical protein